MVEISDPQQLATTINGLPRPLLIGLDVDGTLAPIVAKPDRASLAPGALDALHLLIDRVGVMVAIVSGRPLVDLHGLFELPSGAILVGSHGAEVGTEIDARSDDEQARIETAETKLRDVVERLPGSWIEQKPLAVALHVREADQAQADAELVQLETEFGDDDDLTLHRGHKVAKLLKGPPCWIEKLRNACRRRQWHADGCAAHVRRRVIDAHPGAGQQRGVLLAVRTGGGFAGWGV